MATTRMQYHQAALVRAAIKETLARVAPYSPEQRRRRGTVLLDHDDERRMTEAVMESLTRGVNI